MPPASDPSNDFAEPASGEGGTNGPSICVLDDDLSMLKALDRLLKGEGFRVEKFNNPTAFLSAVKRNGCTVAIRCFHATDERIRRAIGAEKRFTGDANHLYQRTR